MPEQLELASDLALWRRRLRAPARSKGIRSPKRMCAPRPGRNLQHGLARPFVVGQREPLVADRRADARVDRAAALPTQSKVERTRRASRPRAVGAHRPHDRDVANAITRRQGGRRRKRSCGRGCWPAGAPGRAQILRGHQSLPVVMASRCGRRDRLLQTHKAGRCATTPLSERRGRIRPSAAQNRIWDEHDR